MMLKRIIIAAISWVATACLMFSVPTYASWSFNRYNNWRDERQDFYYDPASDKEALLNGLYFGLALGGTLIFLVATIVMILTSVVLSVKAMDER